MPITLDLINAEGYDIVSAYKIYDAMVDFYDRSNRLMDDLYDVEYRPINNAVCSDNAVAMSNLLIAALVFFIKH